jgi:hypothetical protein
VERKDAKDDDKEPTESKEQAAAREKANAAYAKGEQPPHHLAIETQEGKEGEPIEPTPTNPDSWMGAELATSYRNQEPPPPEAVMAIGTAEQKAAATKDSEAAAKKDDDKRKASDEDAKRKSGVAGSADDKRPRA